MFDTVEHIKKFYLRQGGTLPRSPKGALMAELEIKKWTFRSLLRRNLMGRCIRLTHKELETVFYWPRRTQYSLVLTSQR